MGSTLPPEEVKAYADEKRSYHELLAKTVEEMRQKPDKQVMAQQQAPPEPKESADGPFPRTRDLQELDLSKLSSAASAKSDSGVEEMAESMRKLRLAAEKGKDKKQKEHWAKIDELLGNGK